MTTSQGNFPDAPLASPENENPEKFRTSSFLITLSPKGDIRDDTCKRFVEYLKKKMMYVYCVVEYGAETGKRHVHAVCVTNVPTQKRNIQDYWSKILVKEYPGSVGRYACKVTIQYNHDWYDTYLRKGGEVLYDNYERDRVTEYFPDADTQQRLIESKGCPEVRVHIALEMLSEWKDKDPVDSSYEGAITYLKHRMYVEKRTPFYIDPRKYQQMAWFLYEMRNEIISPNVDDRNYGAKMSGNSIVS